MLHRIIYQVCVSLSLLGGQQGPAPQAAAEKFQISGTMVDSVTSRPLAGARVAIAPMSRRADYTTMVTTENGRFSFPGLAAGRYTLTARRRGYLTQSFNQHEQLSSAIVAGPNADSSGLIFPLSAESAIAGVVTDEHAEQVRKAKVMLFQSSLSAGIRSSRQRAVASTDDEGFFHFAHLPAGRYFVAVSAEPWYAQPFMPRNATGFFEAYEHARTFSSFGRAGRPDTPAAETQEGRPSPLDVAYPLTFYPDVTDSSAAAAIVLAKGEKNEIDIHLHPLPALHFPVNTEARDQAEPAWIALENRVLDGIAVSVNTKSITTEQGPMQIIGVPPGHYSLRINDRMGELMQEHDVNLTPGGGLEIHDVVRVPVTAALHFTPPAAAGNIQLQLRNKKSAQIFSARVNDKGEVEFKHGLTPGSYEVSLQTAQGWFLRSMTATGARVTGRTLVIKTGSPVQLTVAVAQGQGEVSGVALRQDKPVAGAMLLLVPADPANNLVLFRRDQSDSDGSFTMAGVVPGRYTLLALENGWDLEWSKPETLSKFMAGGEIVTVEMKGKHTVRVKVQQ